MRERRREKREGQLTSEREREREGGGRRKRSMREMRRERGMNS